MDLTPTERTLELRDKLTAFMDEHIYPNEATVVAQVEGSENRQHFPEVVSEMKQVARSEGLWNLFMPDPDWGPGLTNVEYAPLAEVMGHVPWASEVFNCSAPDTGNMEVLAEFGTAAQQADWLQPLLDGEIRSCFAMTEPEVASSDPTNLAATAEIKGDEIVITGRKWFTSGASHPLARVCIFMGITNPDDGPYGRHSQILVPLETPGVEVVRPMNVYGFDDGWAAHPEVLFDAVTVPAENLIGDPGKGFAIAQARLGPGRIHHCMRTIGMAERALYLLVKRATDRVAFGKPLAEQGVIQDWIAESRIRIDQARLLVMQAAWLIDTKGKKAARNEISAIKVAAVDAAGFVVDRAIQAHGAVGLSQDTPLAAMAAWARALRIVDGPDEVHKRSIARQELKKHEGS